MSKTTASKKSSKKPAKKDKGPTQEELKLQKQAEANESRLLLHRGAEVAKTVFEVAVATYDTATWVAGILASGVAVEEIADRVAEAKAIAKTFFRNGPTIEMIIGIADALLSGSTPEGIVPMMGYAMGIAAKFGADDPASIFSVFEALDGDEDAEEHFAEAAAEAEKLFGKEAVKEWAIDVYYFIYGGLAEFEE